MILDLHDVPYMNPVNDNRGSGGLARKFACDAKRRRHFRCNDKPKDPRKVERPNSWYHRAENVRRRNESSQGN